MFTGIVTDLGQVRRVRRGELVELTIATGFDTAAIAIGASIACSGPCLTVVAVEDGAFTVQASAETVSRTTIGAWREGTPVNLEQSLRLGDELGGHLVSGHVDGLARIVERRPEAESVRFVFEAPEALMPFIAPKGSVALDGVSLTVNEVSGTRFGVNIIPHTLARTSFNEAQPGQQMNLEIDMIARYVARLLGSAAPVAAQGMRIMSRPPHILIVEAPYYAHIAEALRRGAERALAAAGASHETVQVPGSFEIPAAIGIAARASERFDGFVALGCVIRGQTTHYDHICAESARGLQDLAVRDGLAIGYGILTCENEAQALERAPPEGRDHGGAAVRACLAIVELKRRLAQAGG